MISNKFYALPLNKCTFKRVKRQQNMSVLLLNYVWCTSLHKWFFFFFYWITSIGVQIRDHTRVFKTTAYTYVTYSAKRCANFWLSIKSVSNTLSCCCFVCAFIIGQYHSGNNSWRNIIFRKWKAPRNLTPENGHAHSECFRCFHSRTWQIKTLPQSPIYTEEISFYTVHIKSIITKFFSFFS